jgi:ankyrin repeat protein
MSGLEIHEAASTGDFDSLEEYLRSGKFDVNLPDVEWGNRTALHWACAKGKFDVNLPDVEWGNRTALHWACAKGKFDVNLPDVEWGTEQHCTCAKCKFN